MLFIIIYFSVTIGSNLMGIVDPLVRAGIRDQGSNLMGIVDPLVRARIRDKGSNLMWIVDPVARAGIIKFIYSFRTCYSSICNPYEKK
jgi:hypothetical protein